jgi:hypothetical protein
MQYIIHSNVSLPYIVDAANKDAVIDFLVEEMDAYCKRGWEVWIEGDKVSVFRTKRDGTEVEVHAAWIGGRLNRKPGKRPFTTAVAARYRDEWMKAEADYIFSDRPFNTIVASFTNKGLHPIKRGRRGGLHWMTLAAQDGRILHLNEQKYIPV